jgi:hypothetical protein
LLRWGRFLDREFGVAAVTRDPFSDTAARVVSDLNELEPGRLARVGKPDGATGRLDGLFTHGGLNQELDSLARGNSLSSRNLQAAFTRVRDNSAVAVANIHVSK